MNRFIRRMTALAAALLLFLAPGFSWAEDVPSISLPDLSDIRTVTESGAWDVLHNVYTMTEAGADLILHAFAVSIEGQLPTVVFSAETQAALRQLLGDGRLELHEVVPVVPNGYSPEMGWVRATVKVPSVYEPGQKVAVVLVLFSADGEQTELVLPAEVRSISRITLTIPADAMQALCAARDALLAIVSVPVR